MKNKTSTPSNINNFKEIEAEIAEPNTPLSPKKHVYNPKAGMQTETGTPMSQKQKISRAAIDFNGKKVIGSNQNAVAQSQVLNEQESLLRGTQTYNNAPNQAAPEGESYEEQRQRSQMLDKILLEQQNNTSSKRIRKFNAVNHRQGQDTGYDESGTEGIDVDN